jgi:histidinol-phosphate aminotransferase
MKTMTKAVEEYYVPWIKPLKMYVSGHIDLAWRQPSLHRMMSNENPYAPSPQVLDAIMKYAKVANRYPDQGLILRGKIAEMNGLAGPEQVVLGNGSSEIYDMIFRTFLQPGEEVIQHTPCFGIYKLRCDVLGGSLVSVPMIYTDRRLEFDPEGILKAITPKTKIIVVANPNNPTGNFMDPAAFVRIAETGIPFCVDEAYIDYAGMRMSQVGLTGTYRNVIITRTFSKAYGLAGLRFGYLLADRDVAMQIAATLLPWNVGTIVMWAALAALEDQEGLAERVKFTNEQVAYIERALGDIPGLVVFPSQANYILFDAGPAGKKGKEILEFALSRGLILRGESPKYGSDGWFRVTIGTKEENEMFVKVMREFFSV